MDDNYTEEKDFMEFIDKCSTSIKRSINEEKAKFIYDQMKEE